MYPKLFTYKSGPKTKHAQNGIIIHTFGGAGMWEFPIGRSPETPEAGGACEAEESVPAGTQKPGIAQASLALP